MGSVVATSRAGQLATEVILKKIVADFEQLGREIDSTIAILEAGDGPPEDIEVLLRAKEAARKGAALAKCRVKPE